ncbi:hypothetical protein TRSC58_02915 [Trypanosoma rangeli SC58]|uniref:Uncharacterized protein n=1 Tax=Trypanosoma rangeli SC58 TaxID=429131 RepID=A0A061J396_TRYRA|nr:hypothetical protein TRSC58_02915 [Trypanosoma rangeli SC58]
MADYSEWLEATVGTGTLDEATDPETMRQATAYQQRRDAVLCLIDCQLGMFHGESCLSGPDDINLAVANNIHGAGSTHAVPIPVVASERFAGGAAMMQAAPTDDLFRWTWTAMGEKRPYWQTWQPDAKKERTLKWQETASAPLSRMPSAAFLGSITTK